MLPFLQSVLWGVSSVFLINHNFQHNAKNPSKKDSMPKKSTGNSYTVTGPVSWTSGSSLQLPWGFELQPPGFFFNSHELLAQLTYCGMRKLANINKYHLFPFQGDLK